ncbi:MAG TPA: hypothetical protein VFP98_01885 [Candidatus Polarisedimenticolia bacterium]|nr:hypothetical protein [Candidatus Polarisedimenticolia bacterium]
MKPGRVLHASGALALCGLLAISSAPAAAADPPNRPEIGPDEMREDIQETIEIYMIAKLKRALELTDAQERTVIPLVEELNTSRRELNRKRRLSLMKLRPLVEEARGSDPDEREISRLLQELDATERSFRDKETRTREEIRASLSPLQQARFLFFMERFRQEMEQRLRGLRQEQGPRPRPGGGPGNRPRRRP